MEEPPIDLNAWKQKVHAVDMALRTVQQEATDEAQKGRGFRKSLSKPRLPFIRALPSRL
jgi:hypothetical protein